MLQAAHLRTAPCSDVKPPQNGTADCRSQLSAAILKLGLAVLGSGPAERRWSEDPRQRFLAIS